MNEIVKYHNDFNKIKLPQFNEMEQDLLFSMLHKIRDKGTEPIKFATDDLKRIAFKYRVSDSLFGTMMRNLFYKFFKADFTILTKDDKGRTGESIINLFNKVTFWHPNDDEKILSDIELIVNPEFAYLVNELTSHFTRFELEEFIDISGKYAKNLYRQLKQYRTTGLMEMEWQEFKRVMDIPDSYNMCDIEKQILKPAIKELTKERNLFSGNRIAFKNLTYTKQKGKGRGQGGNVVGITFTFLPQIQEAQELERAQKNLDYLANQKKRENRIKNLEKKIKQKAEQETLSKESIESFKQEYLYRNVLTYNEMTKQMDTSKIIDLIIEPDKITIVLRNVDTQKVFSLPFENRKNHSMSKVLESFANWFEKNKD